MNESGTTFDRPMSEARMNESGTTFGRPVSEARMNESGTTFDRPMRVRHVPHTVWLHLQLAWRQSV